MDPESGPTGGCVTGWLRPLALWIVVSLCVTALADSTTLANPAEPRWRHAISLVGDPKYPEGFTATDYGRETGPRGGKARVGALGTFDNLNIGVSGVKGNLAAYIGLLHEPLMWASADEPTTEYGLLAEAVSYPDDLSSASFRLRPEARWHDGRPVTAEDVVWSFEVWKRLSPGLNRTFQPVRAATVVSPREVRFDFATKGDRTLPLYIGQMSVLPKHWWAGKDAQGRPRDIGRTTLEPPLGSGPYRIAAFSPGRSLTYRRVEDYWGEKVPVRVGTNNFTVLQVEYFRDPAVMFEAFKADRLDFRREQSLKNWAAAYDSAALAEGRIHRDAYPIERLGILRAFAFNLRRPKLADWRVRKALSLAFGFDEINRTAFHGLLQPAASFFPATDLEARGAPDEAERRILAEAGGDLPHEALAPLGARPLRERPRTRLRQALGWFRQAGYRLDGLRLVHEATGEPFSLEFLLQDAGMEKLAAAYGDILQKLGIEVRIRVVDDVQYQNRLRTGDFDLVVQSWVQGHAPGSEQRDYWSGASAGIRGSNNVGGLRNKTIDALVERLIHAESRQDLVAAGRALDRALRASHIAIPINVESREYVAWQDRIAPPARMPAYAASGFPELWSAGGRPGDSAVRAAR
jgi:microcin C transport system substrate-binding protein